MKQLAFIYASIFCIVLSANLSIDPAHLLKPASGQSDEAQIAEILLADQQAVVPREKIGFDERKSRQIFLERKAQTDGSIIFGSSRVRYFSKRAFEDERHFVDAVNAATLEDLLVVTYLRDQHQLLPKRLFIALDPWMIEQANSYTRLVQVSYPDAFVQAVEHFRFSLPEGSGRIYKNLAANGTNQLQVPLAAIVAGSQEAGNFRVVAIGKLPFEGKLQISFDGWITEGTYNWAWRVLLNGVPIDEGNYMDNLQGSPSPHQPRTVVTRTVDAKTGDVITLEMAHANNDGAPVHGGLQEYKLRKLSAQITCDNPIAQQYKGWTNCDGYLQPSRYRKYMPIAREMVSPAYFQQSMKTLLQARGGQVVAPYISAKTLCVPDINQANYIFCSDGGVPWPLVENYDSEKVESIVRTIDDGLVPLKSIDENALKLLKQLTDFYVRNGTEVAYVLVPVHPFSYEKWKSENDSRGFLLAEATYRKFASTNGIPIVGSYDPSVVGCKNTDFRDWVHPLPGCTNRIARVLKRLPSSSALHN